VRVFTASPLVLLAAAGLAPAQTYTDKVTTTPIAIQDGFGPGGRALGYNGLAYCGPTAFNMAIGYLGVNGYSRLGSTTPTPAEMLNRERIIAGLAGTSSVGGTTIDGLQAAIDTILQAKGISLTDRSWNVANRPWVTDLQTVNVAPTVNVLLLGWYVDNSGAYRREGGHFITLLTQAPDLQGTGTITINNPDPSSLAPAPDTPPHAQQTLQLNLWPHTSPDLPGPPYASSGRPGFLQFDPSQYPGYLGATAAVLETSAALTVNPAVRNAGYPQNTWTITAANTPLNTNGGNLDVTAPIAGAGGIEKLGPGALNLQNTVALTGTVTVSGGTLSSNQAAGTPFGTGLVKLNNGTLALVPAGSGGAVTLTGVTAAGATFSFGGGAVLSLQRGGYTSLTYTVGPGGTAPLVRNGQGTLVIAASSGTANLGTLEQFVVNGTAPVVTNGMVAPSFVGQDGDANRSGDFLTYGSGGFARAAYTQSTTTPITSTTATTVYEANNDQTVPAGQTAHVQALKVGAFTVGGGAGATLNIAGQGSGSVQAGLILNGGTVGVPTLAFGAADILAYASAAGGTVSGSITGTGPLVKFGPGTLTLGAANPLTGPVVVQSGTLKLTATGATGTGGVTVQAEATAAVAANVQVAGPITVLDYGLLNLDDGSRLNGGLTVNGPNGTVVVSGSPTIAAGSGTNTISGVFQAGATVGTTTFQGKTTFNGSSQYLVRLYQSGSGPTNLVTNSIHFANPGMTDFGFSGSYVNITADLTNVPTPDSGDPFWTTDHTWVIADAASGWNNMWYSGSFIGYQEGHFSLTNDANISTLSLVYTFAPVPEPGAVWLTGLAGLAAWRLRRLRVGV
jgi:autotransporter-associated beta strand protein